jgi:tRNA-2-methylthio-N6-dimethylallyladenosine synthase
MPSVFFETFGCQMNVADSDMLVHALLARGFYHTESGLDADLIVVNTCSIREHAETRAKMRIDQYARHKIKRKLNQQIWVIGCMAQRLGKALIEEIKGVDRVIGAKDIVSFVNDIDGVISLPKTKKEHDRSPISAFVPVMRGCNNFCSYCIVPFVRGEEQSVPVDQIIKSVRDLVDGGAKEITLLGQNVNSYRDGAIDFPDLLEKVHAIDGLMRIRFTTSHPKDCTKKLIHAVASLPKLCKHIHLPAQSGSSRILGLMNRKYTREKYLDVIETIKTEAPGIDLTTDIMVGFPTETEEDFLQTLSLTDSVKFTTAFMFAYSKRDSTAAAAMPDDVSPEMKKKRLVRLIEAQTAVTKDRYGEVIGKDVSVLFTERQHGRDKMWMGQDNGCKRVLLACEGDIAGTILNIRAVRSSGMTLIGERISS